MATTSCKCGPCAPPAEEPIVCTLSDRDQLARVGEFRAVFAHLVATQQFEGGFRWRFSAEPGLEATLVDLARREHDCCRFFEFDITRDSDCIVWETRASQEAAVIMDAFMRLPENLSRDSDLGAIRRAFERQSSS